MPNDTFSFIQRIQEYGILQYIIILIMGFWAGTVKYLTSLSGKKGSVKNWLIESLVCMFVGVLTAMFCEGYIENQATLVAIATLSAHNGTRSLYIIIEIIKKKATILDSEDKEINTMIKLARRKGDENDSK